MNIFYLIGVVVVVIVSGQAVQECISERLSPRRAICLRRYMAHSPKVFGGRTCRRRRPYSPDRVRNRRHGSQEASPLCRDPRLGIRSRSAHLQSVRAARSTYTLLRKTRPPKAP